ncbi:beta strand repeat-containing protein [Fructobacillus pseudoficulneus]|uniref:beta strand repeat-containing protein n=1 Tax=Fructobacillus pseudoficulneus TaxID=220714 RepID=UPI00075087D1|nr:DUF1542 domain-containing protein [Fructobacillus pseudoficulneus]
MKGQINNDPTLLDADKSTQKGKVDAAVSSGDTTLTNADTSAQSLADALAQLEKNLDQLHQPGLDVSTQQANAKTKLAGVAKSTKQTITNDLTLTEAIRQAQRGAVDQTVTTANSNIMTATTAQAIANAEAQGEAAVGNDYRTGDSLDDQKTNAQGQLTSAYNAAASAIQNDVTLTNAVKQTQKATLDANYQNGKSAIQSAGSAQLISDTEFSWAQTLSNSHTVGKDLATQRIDAQTALKTQYTQTKNALLADKTLLTAENQQQAANIDRAYNAAVASLADNQTPNAQAIADAVTTGKANIQAQFVPGDSIGDQQKAAIDAVNQATNDADNLIGQDPTLTTDNVNQQVSNVSAAAKAIIAKISAATDAQTIANAIVNVEERLASLHVPGQSVDTQKGAAGTAVNGAGDQAKQGIQGDPTLNQQTKDAQKAAVNNIVSKAIAAINAETLAAKIDADKQQAIADINAQHKQGQQISDQQTNAIAAITQEANTVKTAIDQDDTSDSSTKDSQKGNVDQAVQQATKNINAATTADTIAAAQTTGINSIDAAHLPGTGISAQRQAALDKVQAEANSVKAAIQADNTLDTATVTSQLANVDTALSAARAAIQAETVTNSDEIGHARDAGIANIDQQYQLGLALSQQQGNAQAQLATYAGSNTSSSGIWHDIDSDVTLTNDQKSQQEQALSNALDSAKTTIGSATNAQAIKDAVANAKTAMTQAHVIGAPVDQQRQLTYRAFLSYAQDVQAAITLDPNLTAAEKQTQMNNLNVVIQNAQSSFAASQITNAQQIAEAKTATSSALAAVKQPSAVNFATRRSQAVSSLDDELTTINSAINQDGTLLATDKSNQKQAAQQAHDAAVTAVQQAGDAETIVEQLAAGIKNIDGAHSSGTAVATQQANAIAILTQTAKDTKKAITNDVSLLEATRASQRSQIDTDLQTVIAAINGISSGDATAADQIQADQTQWNKTIANDHVSGTALAEQKASQKTALENYAGSDSNHQGVWSAIDTDVTLTDADKATQKANLASALSTYEGDIDAAPDAQTLSDLIAKANSAMDASHSAGVSLADRLVAANKQLASKVVQVKAQIAGDPTLTDADVISQSNAVDTAVKELQNELNNDQNAQAIVNTLTNGLTTIAGKYQQQKSLADRRTDATNAINQAVTQAKTAIDTDPTLNKADRTAQEAAVDQAVSTMTDSLNQADTAQKILNVQNTLVQAAAGVHSAGQPIADQQKAANADLEKTADQINQAITADVNLTNAQKTAERANVASALNTAEQAINGLNDAQQILDEKSRQTITIQSQHPLPRQLSDLISDARNAFQTEYSGIHQVIQNDNTLNNSSRASQFAALSNALQAANDSLTGVNNAQQLADVQDKGMKQIDSSHVVGTPLSQQIQAAKDQLTSLADKLNTAVMNDVNLLDSSKTTREGLLTATLSKYTNQLDAANQPNSTANGQTVLDLLQAATTALNNDRTSDDGNGGSQDQPLADQIAAAVKQVSQKSVAVQNLINGDNSLVQSMIDDQTASNTSISNQAITDIKAAVNAQGLANRLSKALQDLNGVYQTNPTSLDDQKAQAIKDFNALYGTVQGQIKNDTGLTSSQKATQLANLDQEKTQGTSQINNVNRAIDLAGIATTVDADLKQAHQVGTNIDVLRQNEQNWYNQQVKSLATTLSASQLSDADSQSVNGAINAAEQTIQGQINSAQNADDLVAMHSSAVTNFANLTVQVKQAQARYTIIATAADQVAAINNDASLTKSGTTGKDAQTSQVNCQRDSLLTSITSAQTTDQVATILSNGVTALEGIHQSAAQTFDQQQSAANTNATAAETAVSKAISDANSNQKISADQNTQLTGVVSQATNDFNAAIKAAKNADDINAAVNQLNTTLANAQLTLQKNQSTNAVNQAAQTVETAIDQDPTLDAGQKATQKQAVQAQQQTANQQIENASTTAAAQAIESNFTSTVPQLHIAGQAIADRRANLKQLVATAVAAANRAIHNDNTLDSAAKQAQLKQVIDAQTTANKAIDAAQNAADGVQAEVNGVNTISALHQAGPISVSQMKANFLALVESLAGTAKQNIGKATTLTADQVNQVTRDATFVHDLSYLNANDAEDADDFETLSNNVQNLYTTVDIELHQLVGLQPIMV